VDRHPASNPETLTFPEKSPHAKSTWERLRLSRDVELHIRRPLTRERNKLVDRLLDAAKNIFAEEP